jgi:hypothetical protein
MAKVNVTLSLSSTDLFAKQALSFTETDVLSPVGDTQVMGKIILSGPSTQDALTLGTGTAIRPLAGDNDRAYLFLNNLSATTGEYIKIRYRAAAATAGTGGDWFAQLGPGEFLFIPISAMQSIDLEPAAGTPAVEFLLLEKALGA